MKRAICAVVLAVCLAACSAGCGSSTTTPAATPGKPTYHAPAARNGLVFKSPELQFQMLRALGASAYGGADIGECLETAMRVDEARLELGEFDTWFDAWNSTAARLNTAADELLKRNDRTGARDTYLRCNTYYNMAEFYLHGNTSDPRIKATSEKAIECFDRAAKLMEPPAERVAVKFENSTIPAYFYRVDTSGRKRPLVIIQTGFDGTQQELYAGGVRASLERGYNVMTFEGPGQGQVLREQGLHFRPDWDKVVTPVVDYAVSRKDVDPGKLTLWGISMGGCLAARAAAREHRLKALILDPAMDMAQVVLRQVGPGIKEMIGDPGFKVDRKSVKAVLEQHGEEMDRGFEYAMKGSVSMTWFMQNGMYVFGVDRPSGFPLKMLDYSLDGLASKITADTLVCDSEQDVEKYGDMARRVYESLDCRKKYVLFTNAEGAGAHCQVGAARLGCQVKLDWLNGVTGNRD